jgi:hypothetical protein
MRKTIILAAMGLAIAVSTVHAQVPLSAYVDANGFIDVQKLTCAQLAGTFQEDADALSTWYSGSSYSTRYRKAKASKGLTGSFGDRSWPRKAII